MGNDAVPETDTLVKGKELFFGDNERLDSASSCVQCHFMGLVDTFNWNPSAYEIANTFADKDISDYEEALQYSMSEKMFTSHEAAENLEESDFYALKAYFTELKQMGPPNSRKIPVDFWVVIFTGILFLVILVCGLFVRKIKTPYFHRIFLVLIITFWSIYFYSDLASIGLQKDYGPPQPIKFSHNTHASQNSTTCIYCHPSVRYSASAGIPGVNVCMNCHTLVREGSKSGQGEIKKLIAASEQEQRLQWIRINNLPEHVQFNHSIHYQVAKIDCVECHGKVEQMDRVKQVRELSMKWCLDCHKQKKVNRKENGYYAMLKNVSNGFVTIKEDSISVKNIGGWDCMNCHH